MTDQHSPAEDFPAAHSMDTQWFAVDKHGHVGVFESGEAGAVPTSASMPDFYIGSDAPDGLELDVDDMTSDADGKIFEYVWETSSFEERTLDEISHFYSILLWLRDDSLLQTAPGNWWSRFFQRDPPTFKRVRHPTHVLATADELPREQLERIISEGLALRTWIGYYAFEAHRYGFFAYSHGDEFENWISGPYIRDGVPKRPLTVDDLPQDIRQQVAEFKMPEADFTKDRAIQPQEDHDCQSWQATWVDLAGEVHGDPQDDDIQF